MTKYYLFLIITTLSAMLIGEAVQGQSIVSETTYSYNSSKHQYLTQTETPNSDGTTSLTISIYAKDYAPGNAFIDTLVANRLISIPIERVSLIKDTANNLYVTGGTITRYNANTKLPEAVLTLEIAEPLPLASFKFSNSATGQLPYSSTEQSYAPDNRYKAQVSFDLYSYNGKLQQQSSLGKISTAYLWDEDMTYLLAEISNAKLEDVAYTSFESFWWAWWGGFYIDYLTFPKGGWEFDIDGVNNIDKLAGNSSFEFDSSRTISRTGLNASRIYSLSYWITRGSVINISGVSTLSTDSLVAKPSDHSGKHWVFVKHKITGGTVINLSGNGAVIDELCLHPQEASMKTYSYNFITPSSHIGGIGDSNGRQLRYKYDSEYRIINIRDVFYNTLEKTDYHIRY